MLSVEMTTIMEPKIDLNGKMIPWELTSISSSKPFINISTTAYEPITSLEDMNFVKTQSFIYFLFYKNTRTISFDIGYSKEAKWFEIFNDKQNEYSNFNIGEFLEEIYSINENNRSYLYTNRCKDN
ncbi:hypothetical protein C1645_459709 [Glomus cerebriforme]|uniref:Uncharacterized protein n=1 Tax=Glomus cerebriforme TaxID=658196 RepID=A0A397SKY4_9GLOM|nr:hypothetical protein C1645_459709 [Glomus cerebriforme]